MVDETFSIFPAPESNSAEPQTVVDAKQRLRDYEDEILGPGAVRINGRIERGSGSPFQLMKPFQQEHYASLERLVEAEQKLSDAKAALAVAQRAHDDALAAVQSK